MSSPQAGPVNLTIVWGCYQGGVETALYYRLKYMNHAGVRSHCYFYYPGMGLAAFSAIPHMVSFRTEDLAAYVKKHRFETVTFVNTLINLDVLRQSGCKLWAIYEMHGYGEWIVHELQRINEREDGGMIRGIVVPAESVAAWAKTRLDKRPDIEFYVATNTIDTLEFRFTDETESFLKHYSLGADWSSAPLLGWVGRLDANKNWSLLLDIFRLARRKKPELKLLAASDLTTSPELHLFYAKAAKYGLIEHIRILPNVPHAMMPLYYSQIAKSGGVLLSTSLSEGYPYHLLEAQACECPVVSSDNQGSKELVEHGGTGLMFPLDDPRKGAEAVLALADAPDVRNRIVQQARQKVFVANDIHLNVSAYIAWLQRMSLAVRQTGLPARKEGNVHVQTGGA